MVKNKYCAVIVESRSLNNFNEIVDSHLSHLPNFDLTIFCNKSFDTLKDFYINSRVINLGSGINSLTYNYLLTSTYFWNLFLEYERVLIFQHDSLILRDGVDEFLDYDYIGSPWKFAPYVGNGGLSIRNPNVMIETINRIPYNYSIHGNEDVYFCNNLRGYLSPIVVANKFSCETIFQMNTFGIHAIEKYLTKNQCVEIRNQYK